GSVRTLSDFEQGLPMRQEHPPRVLIVVNEEARIRIHGNARSIVERQHALLAYCGHNSRVVQAKEDAHPGQNRQRNCNRRRPNESLAKTRSLPSTEVRERTFGQLAAQFPGRRYHLKGRPMRGMSLEPTTKSLLHLQAAARAVQARYPHGSFGNLGGRALPRR